VQVTGTTFDVRWSNTDGMLRVRLLHGVVSVHGPLASSGVTLLPGQELEARPDDGTLRIEPARAEVGEAAPGAAVTTPTPTVPGPESAPPSLPPAPPAQVSPPQGAAPRARAAAPRTAQIGADWPRQVAAGDFDAIVQEAERCGVDGCVNTLSSDRLAALGDAARYSGHRDLARRALVAQRVRFPGTTAAEEAAFFLGRLAEDAHAPRETALRWYDLYLEETPDGTYAAEALGRKLVLVSGAGKTDEAREAARAYLERQPRGAFASRARAVLEGAE
jgi:hypothetical protein